MSYAGKMPFPEKEQRSNVYAGERVGGLAGETVVTVNGHILDPRFDLRNHSPTGFEWGYGGSGPAQLSLAILANEYGDAVAQYWYQDFKWYWTARQVRQSWTLSSEQLFKHMSFIRDVKIQKMS